MATVLLFFVIFISFFFPPHLEGKFRSEPPLLWPGALESFHSRRAEGKQYGVQGGIKGSAGGQGSAFSGKAKERNRTRVFECTDSLKPERDTQEKICITSPQPLLTALISTENKKRQ